MAGLVAKGTTANGRTSDGTSRGDTELISGARDAVDGNVAVAGPPTVFASDDQGLLQMTNATGTLSNIVPTDSNALAFSRTTGQVLNVVYLTKAAVSAGGFFPAGVNGLIKTSTAQA